MRIFVLFVVLAIAAGACAPGEPSSATPATSAAEPTLTAPSTTGTLTSPPDESLAPAPSAGFAFDADSIVGYYETLGYACTAPRPSTQAAGYVHRSCQLVAPDGRTRTIGVVTDPAGELSDAYASVTGTVTETILDPASVLQPFAAFLGATLGESQGESLLPWLAGHLGDAYETTTIADLTVATYTESPDDHSKLYVEIANRAYLDAPTPGASP